MKASPLPLLLMAGAIHPVGTGPSMPSLSDVGALLRSAKTVVLTTHVNPDGDGIGAQIALCAGLRRLGIKVLVCNPSAGPRRLRFLENRLPLLPQAELPKVLTEADLVVMLDANEWSRTTVIEPLLDASTVPRLIIDHHPLVTTAVGVALVVPTAASTGSLVHELLTTMGVATDLEIAQGVYVSIVSDTGNFRFSNTTPDVHLAAAEFLRLGLRGHELYDRLHNDRTPQKLRLLGECLQAVQYHLEGQLVIIPITIEARKRLGVRPEELHDFVDEIRLLEEGEVFASASELPDGRIRFSVRSRDRVDVSALCRAFGGGGHVKASGAIIEGTMQQAIEAFVTSASTVLPLPPQSP